MSTSRKSMFGGKTRRSMEKTKNNFGYLKLPEDLNMFKAEGGTEVTFDILPYVVTDPRHLDNGKHADDANVGEHWWKKPLRVHKNVGSDEITVVCPTTFGKKCPICDYGKKRRKEGADWDELKEIFPKDRSLFVIVLTDSSDCEVKYEEGDFHIFDMSDHLFLNILDEEVGTDVDYEEFPNPYFGHHIKVRFREKKFGKVTYADTSKIDIIPRKKTDQYSEEDVEAVPCLDDLIKVLAYEELEAVYFGIDDLEDGDKTDEVITDPDEEPTPEPEEVTETKPKGRTRKNAAKPAGRKKETEEPKEVPEEPAAEEPAAKKPAASTTRKRCPHGHKFGKDTDQFDGCDDCDIWDDCIEKKEQAANA